MALRRDYDALLKRFIEPSNELSPDDEKALVEAVRAVRGDRDRLLNLLQRYGNHTKHCAMQSDGVFNCTCGWTEDSNLVRVGS